MTPLLVSIPYSPWSRRASLSLRRMGVEHERTTYTPTLSEPWLRWRLGRPFGRLTVPVLLWDGPPLDDSWDIVAWGNQRSDGTWIPSGRREAVRGWHDRSEIALAAGRLRTTTLVLGSPPALEASLPPPIGRLGPLGRFLGGDAARRLLRKYGDGGDLVSWHDTLSRYCDDLAFALDGRDHILDGPSYADLAAALGLCFVSPDEWSGVGPGARSSWTVPDLATSHADLLAWRDGVLAPPVEA